MTEVSASQTNSNTARPVVAPYGRFTESAFMFFNRARSAHLTCSLFTVRCSLFTAPLRSAPYGRPKTRKRVYGSTSPSDTGSSVRRTASPARRLPPSDTTRKAPLSQRISTSFHFALAPETT